METFAKITAWTMLAAVPLAVMFLAWRGGARWKMVLFAPIATLGLEFVGAIFAGKFVERFGWTWVTPFVWAAGILFFIAVAVFLIRRDHMPRE